MYQRINIYGDRDMPYKFPVLLVAANLSYVGHASILLVILQAENLGSL
jgi:hypothetical protein